MSEAKSPKVSTRPSRECEFVSFDRFFVHFARICMKSLSDQSVIETHYQMIAFRPCDLHDPETQMRPAPRADSSAVLALWHGTHRACRLASPSVPPCATLMM